MPGVPPDAADQVKKLFKGLFKRSKSSKGDDASASMTENPPASPAQQAPPTTTESAPAPAPISTTSDTAPQIPQIQHHDALDTDPATSSNKPAAAPAEATSANPSKATDPVNPATPAQAAAPTATLPTSTSTPATSDPSDLAGPATTTTSSPATATKTADSAPSESTTQAAKSVEATSSTATTTTAPEPTSSVTSPPLSLSPAPPAQTKEVEGDRPSLDTMSRAQEQRGSGSGDMQEESKIDSAGPRENGDSGNDSERKLASIDVGQTEECRNTTKAPSPVPGMQATSGPLQDYYHQG